MVRAPRTCSLLVASIWSMILACAALLTCNRAYAEISDREIRQHVREVFTTVDGADAILDGALTQQSTLAGVSWLEVFRLLMAAERVGEKIGSKEYGPAVAEAANSVSQHVITTTSPGSALTGAFAIGRLAALPIELGLRRFARNATNAALNWQIQRYVQARSPPLNRSHAFVMGARDDEEILFTDDGWLWTVGDTGSRTYQPQVPPAGYTPRQVYQLAEAVFEASRALPRLARERQRAEEEFRDVLGRAAGHQRADAGSRKAFEGVWLGRGRQGDGREWTIRITIGSGAVDRIDYDSISCGGVLEIGKIAHDEIEYRERLTYGQSGCVDNGTITLRLRLRDRQSMEFRAAYANKRLDAIGDLRRD